MTVTNMAQNTSAIIVLLQKLQSPDVPTHLVGPERTSQLCSKLSTAVTAITSTPALSSLSLEVVANAVISLNLLERSAPLEVALSSALQDVWTLFDRLFSHNPKGWSVKLFRWCVSLLARVSKGNGSTPSLEDTLRKLLISPSLSPVLELLNQCTEFLVGHGCGQECMEVLLKTCNKHAPSLNWLLAHVVSLHPPQLTSLLLDHTLSSSATSSAHDSSTLSLPVKVFAHLGHTHRHALRVCLVEKVKWLVGDHQVGGTGGEGPGEGRFLEMFALLQLFNNCRSLLDVVAEDILSCVTAKTMMAALVKGSMSSPTTSKKMAESSMSSEGEEDEGEILSDEDMEGISTTTADTKPKVTMKEVVMLLCELICQLPGKLACTAVGIAFDMYIESKGLHIAQEEGIEEGEIVRESGVDLVIDAVELLIAEILSRLHTATCAPHLTPGVWLTSGKVGPGRRLEFVVGMQEGLEMWCNGLLTLVEQKGRDFAGVHWLQEVVTYIGLSCSELRVARALSFLITHAHLPSQLPLILAIFKDVQARHLSLAHSTLQHCITATQAPPTPLSLPSSSSPFTSSPSFLQSGRGGAGGTDDSLLLENFASNMLMVLRVGGKEEGQEDNFTADHMTRCQFGRGLLEQLLPLAQLLSASVQASAVSTNRLILILDLMRSVLEMEWAGKEAWQPHPVTPQSRGRFLQSLIAEYFTLMIILARAFKKDDHTHLGLEVALGKFLWLISWCTRSPTFSLESDDAKGPTSIDALSSNSRVMAYNIVMEMVLSDKVKGFFVPSLSCRRRQVSSPAPLPAVTHSDLLGTYSSLPTQLSPSKFSDKRESLVKHDHRDVVVEPQLDCQSSISLSGHLTQLLVAVGVSSPSPHLVQLELSHVIQDQVAPQFLAQLRQWPDEDMLKYSQERDLTIKRTFDNYPVLWSFLQLVSDPPPPGEPSPLVVCAPILRSLMTVLTQHWQRCCVSNSTSFPWELDNTTVLVECLAKAQWFLPPLSFVGDLLPHIHPSEISSLLVCINNHIKINFESIKNGRLPDVPDKNACDLVKGVMIHHMEHFGHLYGRVILEERDKD